jgi:hypothetical protein
LIASNSAHGENWIHYYQTGKGRPPNVVWNVHYYIDSDSIRREGNLLSYRAKVFNSDEELSNANTFTEMVVDCAAKTRGQVPSHELYATYEGTVGGEELKTVCRWALQAGL